MSEVDNKELRSPDAAIPKCVVTLKSTDLNNKALGGAEFRYVHDGEALICDEFGQASIPFYSFGKFTIEETKPPQNYQLNKQQIGLELPDQIDNGEGYNFIIEENSELIEFDPHSYTLTVKHSPSLDPDPDLSPGKVEYVTNNSLAELIRLIKTNSSQSSSSSSHNVKLNYTIDTYKPVEVPSNRKQFYADVPCTVSKANMNCQISPADTVENMGTLTYAEPFDNYVRCYFVEQPVEPYTIESIELTPVVSSEELQSAAVYEEVYSNYMIWKEQHDKEVAEAQQAIAEAKAREEAQKEQRLATMEYNIRNVEQASAGMAEAVNDMKPKVTFMATREVENIVSDYTSGQGNIPTDIMDIAEPTEWIVNHAYKKGDLITYESKTGFVKQDHTSQANWIPFSTGTEALYGARPKAVNGVYPYVYSMALEVGMIVEHNGIKYRAIQNANELLYEPSAVPALLTPIEEGE